jgi:DNA-binding phage protein
MPDLLTQIETIVKPIKNKRELCRKAGILTASLYRMFATRRYPSVTTLLKLLDALNLEIKLVPKK